MTNTDDLLHNAKMHADTFDGGGAPALPARRVAVLTCMDARVNPHRILGLDHGDAHVIRNAGGVVTDDAIRSLVISQRLLGTEEIVLIHHTRCGMLGLSDDDFRADLRRETGVEPSWAAGGFDDLEEDVLRSIGRIEADPFVPSKRAIRGFVYDIETGRLQEVHPRS